MQSVEAQLPWHQFVASWQRDPGGYAEEEPGWNDLDEAIKWARRRAPIVMLLLGEGGSDIYNAGERNAPGGDPRWKGVPRRKAANVDSNYSGQVFIREEKPLIHDLKSFSALWIDEDGKGLARQDGIGDVEEAIDWGRERAEVVLVAEVPGSYWGTPTYVIRSAGDKEPPGDRLERLRPRAGEETLRWVFSAQVAAAVLDPSTLARRLEDALRAEEHSFDPLCRTRDTQPRAWSPVPAPGIEHSATPHFPDLSDRWIDVVFQVEAPRRKAAHDLAVRVLFDALKEVGESTPGAIAGFEVRSA
jgi:hypothetical protein